MILLLNPWNYIIAETFLDMSSVADSELDFDIWWER